MKTATALDAAQGVEMAKKEKDSGVRLKRPIAALAKIAAAYNDKSVVIWANEVLEREAKKEIESKSSKERKK